MGDKQIMIDQLNIFRTYYKLMPTPPVLPPMHPYSPDRDTNHGGVDRRCNIRGIAIDNEDNAPYACALGVTKMGHGVLVRRPPGLYSYGSRVRLPGTSPLLPTMIWSMMYDR